MLPSGGRPLAPLPQAFAKRVTLTQQLASIRQLPEAEQTAIIDQAERDTEEFTGFRHSAPATQNTQDKQLAKYQEWIAFRLHKKVEDFTPEELDEAAFPADDMERLCDNLRFYLISIWEHAKPPSHMFGDRISYGYLAIIRDALQFWIKYKRFHKGLPAILASHLNEYTTEVMRAVVKKHPNKTAESRRQNKPYLGLSELRELIDYDMIHTRSIEYSEQHQAAWCIARLTACRPGSICRSGKLNRNPGLKWGDLEFEVDGGPGQIKLTIHFWSLAIKQSEDPEKSRGEFRGASHVEIRCPAAGNLIFSAAHRLLVIAIRRGILKDITSIEELLQWNRKFIHIKPEHHDDVLFYRGTKKGTGIDTSAPLRSGSLSDYLKSRCHKIGYTIPSIGMNSIRRRAATDLTARIGAEATRRIMGHSPNSSILERYYLYVGPLVNQTGALLEEEISGAGFEDGYRRQWAPLVAGAIDDVAIRRTRGAALRSMVDRLASVDETPPDDLDLDTVDGRRQYRQRLRLYAHRALLEHEKEQASANITQEEFDGRLREALASKFADAVAARALELQAEGAEVSDGIENAGLYVPEEEDVDEDEEQPDLEEDAAEVQHFTVSVDDDNDMGVEATDPSYAFHVQAFMETLLYNTMNQERTWAEGDTTCPDCQEDDTVDEDAKERKWSSAQKLEAHRNSNFHAPLLRFHRTAERRREDRGDGLYECPYCEKSETNLYVSIIDLEDHIKKSDRETDGAEHDDAKDADGWYDAAFFPHVLAGSKLKRQQEGIRAIKKMGVKVVNYLPSTKESVPGEPNLTRGGGYDAHDDFDGPGLSRGSVDPWEEERKKDLGELVRQGSLSRGPVDPWAEERKRDWEEMIARGYATRGT